MKKIMLANNKGYALVDDEDYEKVLPYNWHVRQKKQNHSKYAGATCYKNGVKKLLMHSLIMGKEHGKVIDHINQNGLDNRKENLRFVTKGENNQNVKSSKKCTSKYRGVYKNGDYYIAYVKRKYAGRSKCEGEAAMMYNELASSVYEAPYLNDYQQTRS
jgi:hypothetical protein